MTPLPKRISLGYMDYRVKRETLSPGTYGTCDPNLGTISIGVNQNPVDEANTVIHELLHAMCRMAALPLADKDEEEQVVTVLANQLTEVWRRNPDLIQYLHDRLGTD